MTFVTDGPIPAMIAPLSLFALFLGLGSIFDPC